MSAFEIRLQEVAAATERILAQWLADGGAAAAPHPAPTRLLEAMRHGALGGGKRLRPFLLVETARLLGGPPQGALLAGAALEGLHCYSLVHDDLPAMDDDDLRRGRPTVHKAFDEATAILAGDGLLTLAFEGLADPAVHPDPAVRIALVGILARAAGGRGMVGGQVLDIAAETQPVTVAADIERLQAMKTGALFLAAVEMGATLGRAGKEERARLAAYGRAVGAAFQIADDLLDHEGDAAAVGKRTGKDAARGKATLVALEGADWARARLAALVAEAEGALRPFGAVAAPLAEAARFAAARRA